MAQLLWVATEQNCNMADFPRYKLTNNYGVKCFDPQETGCLFCDPSVGRCWEASKNSLLSKS